MPRKRTAWKNPTVERVRSARKALAKDCNYDIESMGRMLMARQAGSKRRYLKPRKKSPTA